MNLTQSIITLAAASSVSIPFAFADRPPADGPPIVEMVEQLEQQGYGPFSELDYDDGHWEIEVYKDDVAYELTVERGSGKILSEYRDDSEQRPPHDAMRLSQILSRIVKAGYTDINEVSFERRYWEVEALRENVKRELHIQPTAGEIINDRRDDD